MPRKPRSAGDEWTGAEERRATQLYLDGMAWISMAHILGRTERAIRHKLTKLGVLRRNGRNIARSQSIRDEEMAAAKATLRAEIAAAQSERAATAPYRSRAGWEDVA